jgi:hypothetical protein
MEPFFLDQDADRLAPQRQWRWSAWARAGFVLAGVVVPILCFVAAKDGVWTMHRPWQSGSLDVYASLLLRWGPASAFYPLLAYSMVCLVLLVVNPARFSQSVWVRMGIYSGLVLAIQYFALVFCPSNLDITALIAGGGVLLFFLAMAIAIPWGIGAALAGLTHIYGLRRVMIGLTVLALFVLSGAIAQERMSGEPWTDVMRDIGGGSLVFILSICVVGGTPWAIACYGTMTVYLITKTKGLGLQFSLLRLMGLIAWLAAYLAAWRVSILRMLEEYAQLPTENPNCYIATAAACGHRRIVGSSAAQTADGVLLANDQLRTLKCAELVLARLTPRIHHLCRKAYDTLGPPLATGMRKSPFAADAAFVLLKPAQWLAQLALTLLAPGWRSIARSLYR